jgi:hypothetical protein
VTSQRRLATLVVLAGVAAATICATALARHRPSSPPPTVKVELYSQSETPTRAQAHAAITVAKHRPGRPGQTGTPSVSTVRRVTPSAASSSPPAPIVYPTLPERSPLAQDATPLGSGSFWYPDGSGHYCIYQPESDLPCYTLTARGGEAVPDVAPEALAARAAAQVDVTAGQVQTSPALAGVTGAASWFWLDPTPTEQTKSVGVAGESVTVDAKPSVIWQFGDGADVSGPGVPYRPGSPPTGAVTHSYETRCLPGDQGRDPNVLGSCGAHGYRVVAAVIWSFDYQATGSVGTSGTLPARSTASGLAYPVSEVRAFLTGSNG